MENRVDIKRKHTRFPAYDDEIGVKIVREGRRSLFQDNETLITSSPYTDNPVEEQRSLRRNSKTASEKSGHSIEQQRELEKHRANLPDYGKSRRIEKTSTGKKRLFGDGASRASYIVRTKEVTSSQELEKQVPQRTTNNTRFVPTYVPASVIPDKNENEVSQDELMAAMKKSSKSILLFDTEPAAYQAKENEEEPSVQKFHGNEKSSVKMTRSQYKKMGKKKNLFDNKNNKGKSILERSLSGLIEEDRQEMDKNGYFSNND